MGKENVNELEVNSMEARILGALQEDALDKGIEAKQDNEIKEEELEDAPKDKKPEEKAKEEVKVEEKKVEEIKKADKSKEKIDKKKEAFKANFKLPEPEKTAEEQQIDWKSKAEQTEKELTTIKAEKEAQQKYEAESTAYNKVKEVMGNKFTPLLDETVAKLIDSDVYDKLSGLTPEQRILMLVQTATGMIGEEDNKLVEEVETEIKSKADLTPKGTKEAGKKGKIDLMKQYTKTRDEDILNEAIGVNEDLEFIFGDRK